VGMTAIIENMREWAQGWLPEELYGGIKGKSADELHDRLQWALGEANRKGESLTGGKIDLKKCFDTVNADRAIDVWECWGAPKGVVRVLREFYARHERWVEFRRAVHAVPTKPARSLLQGCPASPLLLGGIMAIWAKVVRTRVPDVSMGVFLDDRVVWTTEKGSGGSERIKRALAVGRSVDQDFGLMEHPDKRELFANGEGALEELREKFWGCGGE
jgi:hypothetical protein